MNVRLLIDGIMRQTTVLIAQLSTASGVRAPLAHVADQVFLDLAREIEAQGVGRKVVADMFGMALRAYQKKVQRLEESATDRGTTLWQGVLEFIRAGSQPREAILQRFYKDGERDVGAVLSDLVNNGFVYVTGRGETSRYGLSSDADLHAMAVDKGLRSIANIAWLRVFLGTERTVEALATYLDADVSVVENAVKSLMDDGRLRLGEDGLLVARNVVIPVGASDGWEAAVLDHYRAVATAIAQKAAGAPTSATNDEVGGTTLSFSVYPGHPFEEEVRSLLRTVRASVHDLWTKASDYNQAHEVPENAARVLFYCGQLVAASELEAGAEK
ncbi:MAG TPA: hypothetical protein VH062_10585 [Polyangiaceae bacterium]|nr:hypothetical protein [Polyangiaceae bacterium]